MLDATNAWTPAGGVAPTTERESGGATVTWLPSLGLTDMSGVGLGLLIAIVLLAYWYRRVL